MSDILLNETIRIRVTFRDWSDNNDQGSVVDPVSVAVYIRDSDLVILFSPAAVKDSVGVYHYDWTPSSLGDFFVEFDGIIAGGSHNIVREPFSVVTANANIPADILGEDQFITFMPQLTPIYLDPEEILLFYPTASLMDINELLYFFSSEVLLLLGEVTLPQLAYDYIRAAVLCSLSRIYEGIDSGSISSIQLGDFAIQTRGSTTTFVDAANATTWCALAYVLWRELAFNRVGFKAVEKGTRYVNPIPIRSIDKTRIN